eukprot:1040061-Rhodomonas_salina.1
MLELNLVDMDQLRCAIPLRYDIAPYSSTIQIARAIPLPYAPLPFPVLCMARAISLRYDPTRCPVLRWRMAYATGCPVLTSRMARAISLRCATGCPVLTWRMMLRDVRY